MIRYARAPSRELRTLLGSGNFLAPLLSPYSVAGLSLDVHFRERDHVQVYCGLTRVVDASLSRGKVHVKAHSTYTEQSCGSALFRTWSPDEGGFESALRSYYGSVVVADGWTKHEGAVQAAWASMTDPWIPLDREAVLGHGDSRALSSSAARDAVAPAWSEARSAGLVSERERAHQGQGEVDQLAVDPAGQLVLIELKDGSRSAAATHKTPLQLLYYVHLWAAALEEVRAGLEAIREARVLVGLSPPWMPAVLDGLRPVIAFGEDHRSAAARARLDRSCAIANRHLPRSSSPIEVWAMWEGRPLRAARW